MTTPDEERDQLDTYQGVEPVGDIDAGPLEIPDQRRAAAALRRLQRIADDEAQVRALYDQERASLDAYLADRLAGIGRARAWVLTGLESYMRAVARMDPTVRTLKLPSGTLTLTKPGKPRVEATGDLPAVWKRTPPAVPDKAGIGRALKPGPLLDVQPDEDGVEWRAGVDAAGEVVPGVVFVKDTVDRFGWSLPGRVEDEGDDRDGA